MEKVGRRSKEGLGESYVREEEEPKEIFTDRPATGAPAFITEETVPLEEYRRLMMENMELKEKEARYAETVNHLKH